MSDSSTITVRSNLHLWLLTGRSDDFFNDSLNAGIRYSISDTPPEVLALRKLLKLDVKTTDFFVLSALAASKISTSFIRTLPHENDAVFVKGLLRLPLVSTSHPMLKPDDHSWPSINGARAGRDGFTSLVVESLGGGDATITTSNGATEPTTYNLTPSEDGDYRLYVEKIDAYGVNAQFLVSAWEIGDKVTVSFSPTKYPFAKMAAAILNSGEARALLNSEGTMQAFAETSDAAVKVGLMSIAIIRRMLRYINESQAGFTATSTVDSTGATPLLRSYSVDPIFSASLNTPKANENAPVGFNV